MVKIFLNRDDRGGTNCAQFGVVGGFGLAGPGATLVFAVVVGGARAVALFLLVVLAEEELENGGDEKENTDSLLVRGVEREWCRGLTQRR